MTSEKPPFDEAPPSAVSAFDELARSSAELNAALDLWDCKGRWLIQEALDRVGRINIPEPSGLRDFAAGRLKAELDRLPDQGEQLVPEHAAVIRALLVWLAIVRARVTVAMRAVAEIDPEQIAKQFGVLQSAYLDSMRDPNHEGNRAKLDEELAKAKAMMDVLNSPVTTYARLIDGADHAIGEIADTFHEAAKLLLAQLRLLVEFLNQTAPKREQSEPSGLSKKTITKIVVKETAFEFTKEAAKEAAKAGFKTATLGAGVLLTAGMNVRDKNKEIREQREEMERREKLIRAEPRAENYMFALSGDLEKGHTLIVGLIAEIKEFTTQLRAALA